MNYVLFIYEYVLFINLKKKWVKFYKNLLIWKTNLNLNLKKKNVFFH